MESPKRSIVKTLCWIVLSSGSVLLCTLLLIGNTDLSLIITLIIAGLQGVLYFAHERIWGHSTYGRDVDLNLHLNVDLLTRRRKRKIIVKKPRSQK